MTFSYDASHDSPDAAMPPVRTGLAGLAAMDLLRVPMRRWWLILLALLVAAPVAYWRNTKIIDLYSTDALLRKKTNTSVDILGLPGLSARTLNMAEEEQVIRSKALLREIVDSLGLRVTFDPSLGARRIISAVVVDADAVSGNYDMVCSEDVCTLMEENIPVASAKRGEWLKGRGFHLQISPGAPPTGSNGFHVAVVSSDDAIRLVQSRIGIEQVRSTDMLRVRYTDPDPAMAAAIGNAVARTYRRFDGMRSREMASKRVMVIGDYLDQLSDSLAIARTALLTNETQAGGIEAPERFAAELAAQEKEVKSLREREAALQNIGAMLRTSNDEEALRYLLVQGAGGIVPYGETLYSRWKDLKNQRRSLTVPRYGSTDAGPQVEVIDSMIVSTKAELAAVVSLAQTLEHNRTVAAEARVAEMRNAISSVPEQTAAARMLKQRVEGLQRMFDDVANKRYEARVAAELDAGVVEIVDPAVVPQSPDGSNRRRPLAIILLVGLLAGVGGAFCLENLDATVRRVGEAEAHSGLKVIGMLPLSRPTKRGSKEDAQVAEAVRQLRTTIRFARASKLKTIMVTSPAPGEGKSSVASSLAASFSEQGDAVLLIDGDLRRPVLHRAFELDRLPGLVDVLVGEFALLEAAKITDNPHLTVLTAGSVTAHPAELLGSDAFVQLLQTACEHFQHIIIDSPPVLAVADARGACSHVDAVVVVARVNETNRHALTDAIAELRKVNAPLLGLVLNAVPGGSGYGRYGAYGYYRYYAYQSYANGGSPDTSRKAVHRVIGRPNSTLGSKFKK